MLPLYDVFGLRERNSRGRFVDRTKELKGDNAPSAGKIPLKLAKSEHPFFKYVLDKLDEAQEPRVQLSNIFGYSQEDGTVKGGLFMPTGRLRTSMSAVGTETTRFASKKSAFWDGGNLQNIRGKYRDWIKADDGKIFLDVDYSQSDDVFIAYESQDPDKIAVIEAGLDSHAVNGELFFGMPYDQIVAGKKANDPLIVHPTNGIRQISKRIVHGSNFQMAAMTLYVSQMGRDATLLRQREYSDTKTRTRGLKNSCQLCGKAHADSIARNKATHDTKEWYAEILHELKTKGSITNAYGITRNFLGSPEDNGTQREATRSSAVGYSWQYESSNVRD
jgi:hypothetical protein